MKGESTKNYYGFKEKENICQERKCWLITIIVLFAGMNAVGVRRGLRCLGGGDSEEAEIWFVELQN